MSDRVAKGILAGCVLLHAGALAAGFAGLGWRWPLIAATALVAVVVFAAGVPGHGIDNRTRVIAVSTLAALVAGGLHALSEHPAAAWSLRIVFALQALALLAVLIFFLTFRLNRLW